MVDRILYLTIFTTVFGVCFTPGWYWLTAVLRMKIMHQPDLFIVLIAFSFIIATFFTVCFKAAR